MPPAKTLTLVAGAVVLALVAGIFAFRITRADEYTFSNVRITDVSDTFTAVPWGPLVEAGTDVAFLPDGSALVTRKGGWDGAGTGEVLHLDSEGANPRVVLEVPVCADAERGLVGMAIDPNFSENGYVYLDYVQQMNGCAVSSYDAGPDTAVTSRVSRFTFADGAIDPASELVLLEGMNASQSSHVGGGLAFLPDGTLLIAAGEAAGKTVAHSPDHYEGKILRIDPRTPGVAPADNPFAEAPYATTEPRNVAWATGLRNPFRFIVDPVTSKVIAADVGTDVYEELNIVEPGKDYGYPEIEGPGSEGGAIEPMLWYRHEAPPGESDENKVCTSIIGTTFVDGAIVGAPDERAIAYADFGCGRVWVATVDLDAGTVGEVFEIGQVSYSTSAVVSHPDGGIVALAAGPGDQQTLKFQPA